MIILPGSTSATANASACSQGDYATAEQVAEDPVKTAQSFEEQGARWCTLSISMAQRHAAP